MRILIITQSLYIIKIFIYRHASFYAVISFTFASKFFPYSQSSKKRSIYQCRLWIGCSLTLKLLFMEHSSSFSVPRAFKQICVYIVQCPCRSTGCQDLKQKYSNLQRDGQLKHSEIIVIYTYINERRLGEFKKNRNIIKKTERHWVCGIE